MKTFRVDELVDEPLIDVVIKGSAWVHSARNLGFLNNYRGTTINILLSDKKMLSRNLRRGD